MAIDIAARARQSYEELWHKGNLDFIDLNCEPDFVAHDAFAGELDRDGFKKLVGFFRDAFPDIRFRLEDVLVSGTCVTVRWVATGTHRAPLMDIPPTGRRVEVRGIGLSRYAGGMEVESWQMWDVMGLMQQLGVVPVLGMPTSMHLPHAPPDISRPESRH